MPAKILVVEDNADARNMLAIVLRARGFEVAMAADGQAALGVIQESSPDLIITDIEMPILDGVQLIRQLRQRAEARKVPILVMSACGYGSVTDALAAGANAAATKPVHLDDLVKLIRRLLAASATG